MGKTGGTQCMTKSFVFRERPKSTAPDRPRKVLITGAGGRIGRSLATYARDRYPLRLLVHDEDDRAEMTVYGETWVGEICDPSFMREACCGMDTVVHLAADPSAKAQWESLRENNVEGTYQVFKAALGAGCRRVILASSIHAVSGYPQGYQVHPEDPVNPGDLYGVSKCFGEALARMVAEQHGLSSIVLRIGAVQSREQAKRAESLAVFDAFVSHRDLDQLICCCIDDDTLMFAVLHGLSNNRFNSMDISTAEQLVGYAPEDDFSELNRALAELKLRESVRPHNAREKRGKALDL